MLRSKTSGLAKTTEYRPTEYRLIRRKVNTHLTDYRCGFGSKEVNSDLGHRCIRQPQNPFVTDRCLPRYFFKGTAISHLHRKRFNTLPQRNVFLQHDPIELDGFFELK